MVKNLLSIIIPSRNEPYLKQTVQDLIKKAKGDIEIIIVLDGYWPKTIFEHKKVHFIHFSQARGMREAINSAFSIVKGEYVMKIDAHCMVGDHFDEFLKLDCDHNWVVVPRRYSLDAPNWKVKDKAPIDYMYLSHPEDPKVWGGKSLQGKVWFEKNKDESLKSKLIDDLMTAQGSCWFMKSDYYKKLELMDEENYGEFGKEMQEIGLKCWLSGGRMVRNKKTWYAHWHKPKSHGRGYPLSKSEFLKASKFTKRWVDEKLWHKQTKDFSWLINKFKPIPGWKKYVEKQQAKN